jgi:hypothetical protein
MLARRVFDAMNAWLVRILYVPPAIRDAPLPGPLNGVVDDGHLTALRARNAARIRESIDRLGDRYCLFFPTMKGTS